MSNNVLILVVYYSSDPDNINSLVEVFEGELGIYYDNVIIVNNNSAQPICATAMRRTDRFKVVAGTNHAWEFSGWTQGLASLESSRTHVTVTLLNDSFLRNWTITKASRGVLKSMYQSAQAGNIAIWHDIFSWFTSPILTRRPNSRVVFLDSEHINELRMSIDCAIMEAEHRIASGLKLFSKPEEERIKTWIKLNSARWDVGGGNERLVRIYIEHHLADKIDKSNLKIFPKFFVGSIINAAARRLAGERR